MPSLHGLFWEGNRKMVTTIAGTIAAVMGAITATHSAWPIVEPVFPAHRGFVIEKVGDVQATANELLRWKLEDAKAKIDRDIDGWSIQLEREDKPTTKGLIERQIQSLKADSARIDDRIKSLK